jgi:hypothetical protein
MRHAARAGWVIVIAANFVLSAQAQSRVDSKRARTVGDPAGSAEPLAIRDLHFDSSFAQLALTYLRTHDQRLLLRISESTAADHLLNHARNFDYDVPKDSTQALVSYLLNPREIHLNHAPPCEKSLAFFSEMVGDPGWVSDTLRYLPTDFRFHGTLFLTFGYDIGVAFGPNASLNCAHRHFDGHPRELLYYAIHELHHVGFMSYHAPPKISAIKTCGDILRLVEYSTQLEGMAVYAAYQRRSDEHALSDDDDYIALQGDTTMRRDEMLYWEDFHRLEARTAQPADADARAVITRMSSGDRLWYRVGARMAQRIEAASGRQKLIELIKQGPAAFIETYKALVATANVTDR